MSGPIGWGGEGGTVIRLTCGCKLPHDDHGKPDHHTIENLEASAATGSMGLDEAVRNLVATVEVARTEADHDHR